MAGIQGSSALEGSLGGGLIGEGHNNHTIIDTLPTDTVAEDTLTVDIPDESAVAQEITTNESVTTNESGDSSNEEQTNSAQEERSSKSDTSEGKSKRESVRDSVAKSLKELRKGSSQAQAEGAQGEVTEKPAGLDKNATRVGDAGKIGDKLEVSDLDLTPPERFNAVEKQIFNNAPKGIKKGISRMVKEHEATLTKKNAEYSRAIQESQSLVDAVRPFAADFGEKGFTIPAGIAALASAQRRLTNPETSLATYIALGRDLKIPLEQMSELLKGGGQSAQTSVADISSHPQFRALQEKVTSLESGTEQAQIKAAAEPITAQFRAVQQEIDPSTGNFRYPELHDDDYLDSLKPLVSALVQAVPGIEFGEALKRAHFSKQGTFNQGQARLPAANNNAINNVSSRSQTGIPQRSVSAAVTVRGKTPTVSSTAAGSQPPPEALKNPRATTAWVLEQMRNGTIS